MNCPYCGVHIDEHPASRCLDAWVAEAVFGGSANPANVMWYYWDSSDDEGKRVVLGIHIFAGPHFSTDIAAAWEVEEKIEERKLRSRYSQALVAQMLDTVVNSDEHMWWLLAHASPHHRCRAAIKAVQA